MKQKIRINQHSSKRPMQHKNTVKDYSNHKNRTRRKRKAYHSPAAVPSPRLLGSWTLPAAAEAKLEGSGVGIVITRELVKIHRKLPSHRQARREELKESVEKVELRKAWRCVERLVWVWCGYWRWWVSERGLRRRFGCGNNRHRKDGKITAMQKREYGGWELG